MIDSDTHFAQLDDADLDRLFLHRPRPVRADAESESRALSLGATLYTPGIRPDLIRDIAKAQASGARSQVLCLEDSIADHQVGAAQANVIRQIRELSQQQGPTGYQLFVRVRRPEQITQIVEGLGESACALSGFVLPKFGEKNGSAYLDALAEASDAGDRMLWAMPVLETAEIIYRETRTDTLLALDRIIDKHRDQVLALRIGATDLSAVYGLRRRPDVTLWDVGVVASAIADIVNVFARPGSGLVITGPVWEYFSAPQRVLRTQLRATPFAEHSAEDVRARIMAVDLDGLIREAVLDRVNGLVGKTVIHPSHIHPVHSLLVVSAEEHQDALDIVAARHDGGGVRASGAGNKMNEAGPHHAWAERVIRLAELFGVMRPDVTFVDLLTAGQSA